MENKELIPFEATHPGSLIKDELDSRGINQKDFAHDIDMQATMLNEIVKGKRPVTASIALLLEKSLGIPADYWMRFQAKYELDIERIKERSKRKLQLIEHWNIIKELVPVKWFRKLGVFVNDLEKDIQLVKQIYQVDNIEGIADSIGALKASSFYRKSDKLKLDEVNLLGWSKLAAWKCKDIEVNEFDKEKLNNLIAELRKLFYKNKNTRDSLINLLGKYGIKLIFQPKFEKTPVDGYSFISNNKPAIALTLRHKRIDNLAFTLMHELGHIELHLFKGGQSEFIDLDLKGIFKDKKETEADEFAQKNLINQTEWKDFETNYVADDDEIIRFSDKYKIHPYIVFGRICHETDFYGKTTQIKKEIN
jgi:HTH-type transcriptional regulator / antitoxin HigA